jgi:hypothetical protein
MKIKFHHWLAIAIVTLFLDIDLKLGFARIRIIDVWLLSTMAISVLQFKFLKLGASNAIVKSFYVFLAYVMLNGILKVSIAEVIKELIQQIEYIYLAFLIARELANPKTRTEFITIIFWGTGAVALYSMYYHVSRGHYSGYKDLDGPKHAFAYFAVLGVLRYMTNDKRSVFQIVIILWSFVMMLLSGERKGWAGAILALSLFVLVQFNTQKNKRKLFTLLRIFVISIVFLSSSVIFLSGLSEFKYFDRQLGSVTDFVAHLTESDDKDQFTSQSNAERVFMLNYGMILFYKDPFTGIGIDQFSIYVSKYTGGDIDVDAHNFYLKILVEQGAVGLMLFIITNVLIVSNLWRKIKNKDPAYTQYACFILAIYVLGVAVNLFLAGKALNWFYIITPIGMILSLERQMQNDRIKQDEDARKIN